MGRRGLWMLGIVAALATGYGCGSSSNSPAAPSSDTGTIAGTITIDASGAVSPRDITVPAGSRVTFVNNHSRDHEMNSDPHPEHTLCPALNSVGHLTPGQSRTSGNLNTPGVCTYHDHINDTNNSLKGTIRVQ
jgi:plastocyanin